MKRQGRKGWRGKKGREAEEKTGGRGRDVGEMGESDIQRSQAWPNRKS